MRKFIGLALPCLAVPFLAALGGCVSETTPGAGMSTMERVYVRADGKRLNGNPALMAKLDTDKSICRGKAQEIGLVAKNEFESKNLGVQLVSAGIKESKIADVMQGCMAERGYLYMSVAEAESRADELSAKPKKRKKVRTAMN